MWACWFPSEYTQTLYYSSAYIDSIVKQQSHEDDVNNPMRGEKEKTGRRVHNNCDLNYSEQ